MNINEILDEIIAGLQPEDVSVEFIVLAKVTDFEGIERTLKGKDLVKFLNDPNRPEMAEAKVFLNVRKIKMAILTEVDSFFKYLEKKSPPLIEGE